MSFLFNPRERRDDGKNTGKESEAQQLVVTPTDCDKGQAPKHLDCNLSGQFVYFLKEGEQVSSNVIYSFKNPNLLYELPL